MSANTITSRITALDGLRGIAALLVVVHHSLLTSPVLARAYGGPDLGQLSGWAWAISYTPAHLVWAGTEAVYVFFVLSGFVLTVATESARFSWASYYPSRLLRLYLPVATAVAFAVFATVAVPRTIVHGASWWLNAHAEPRTLASVVYNATLVRYTTYLNSPLWSLKWEVYFSVLLPIYVLGARRARIHPVLGATLLLAAIGVGGASGNQKISFLPMFALGVLMATHRHRLNEAGSRLGRRGGVALLGGALLLLTARWTMHPVLTGRTDEALVAIEALGATAIVFLFATWSAAKRLGDAPPTQWLGRRSFSLYLVHEPIVVSSALLFGSRANPLLTLAVALPVSLLAADVFFRLVEGPSHRMAQKAGRKKALVPRTRSSAER